MQTLSEIKALLAERGLRPRHRFGQNFLHDKNQLTKLIKAADTQPGEVILEVGPGTGTLTETLVERGAEVIAVEIDRDLAAIVREHLDGRITLIEGDCLEGERKLNRSVIDAINGRSFKLVSNLPYQIASPLMACLLIDHHTATLRGDAERRATHRLNPACTGQFITIQKEVADRLLAPPRTKEYGPLTIIVRALAEVRKIATLAPSCFWPPPEVTSAMVAIVPRRDCHVDDPESFARFVANLFSKRRKQLGAIFGRDRAASLLPQGATPDLRPEALTVEQLIALERAARLSEDSP